MSLKTLRNILIATTGVAVLAIVGVGIWSLLGGYEQVQLREFPIASNQTTTEMTASTAKSEPKPFDHLWSVTLQEPRTGSTSTTASAIPQIASANFPIRLVGTIIESTQSLGIFQDGSGNYDVKGAGQRLDLVPTGAEVSRIEPSAAIVRFEGREQKLDRDTGNTPLAMNAGRATNPTIPADASFQDVPEMSSQPNMSAAGGEDMSQAVDVYDLLPANMNPTRPIPDSSDPGSMGPQP